MSEIRRREEIRKQEIAKIRKILARDFHDDMGNKLAGITVTTSTLDLLIQDPSPEVKKALQNLEALSKDLFTGTKSFIWSMNPENDSLKEIVAYIQHFAVDALKGTGISFQVLPRVDELDPNINLPMGASRQLYFIMKEAITNAMVHADATELTLTYQVSNQTYKLSLRDNGKGMTDGNPYGNGLENMKARSHKINAHLSYYNNKDAGFCVEIVGNLPGN